jgi:diguanylate cyclase
MVFERSRLYESDDAHAYGDLAAAPIAPKRQPRSVQQAVREIDTLRSINAHLARQIEELKQREAQAQRLAHRDGLTGLYNRRRMVELLAASIAEAAPQRQRVGLLFCDLDGFKGVNDSLGHSAGDKLLITIASRIAARARTGDFVCRYGGDEFVVILPRVADVAAVHQVADSIRKRVALPCRIDGADVHISAAVGVAIYPDEARSAATLLELADESMYRAKFQWRDPLAGARTAPARRRDDKARRRVTAG